MADSSALTGKNYPGAATARPSPKKVAFESLTAKEAAWHVVVLVTFVVVYLIMVVTVRLSAMARFFTLLLVVGTAGLLVAVLTAFTMSHRSSALQSLRSAIASGDAKRIREAIWRAQAAGVSAEDAAATQELRALLAGKLQSALEDRDVEKLGMAVRCAQAVKLAGDKICAAVETSVRLPRASVLPARPRTAPEGADAAASRPSMAVGMTAAEVAFAEDVLTFDQDAHQVHIVVQRPHSPPVDCPVGCRAEKSSMQPATVEASRQLLPSSPEECLKELHLAVEGGEAAQLRAAITAARAAGVGAEEVTLAQAVLQIEERRLQRSALHALKQAGQRFTTLADSATFEDVAKLRAVLRKARNAGVNAVDLHTPEALLISAEARLGPPRRAQTALRPSSVSDAAASPKKRVTFADGSCRILIGGAWQAQAHPAQ